MFAPPVAKPTTKPAELQRATVSAQRLGHSAVEQMHMLQRSIGNQAVLRILAQRAGVNRSEPGAHENEGNAARTAAQQAAPSWDFAKIPVFSSGGAERFRPPPLFPAARLPIQAKLEGGAIDDPPEHEADRVAEQVIRTSAPGVPSPPRRRGSAANARNARRRKNFRQSRRSRNPPPARRPVLCMKCCARRGNRSMPERGIFSSRDLGGILVRCGCIRTQRQRSRLAHWMRARIRWALTLFSPQMRFPLPHPQAGDSSPTNSSTLRSNVTFRYDMCLWLAARRNLPSERPTLSRSPHLLAGAYPSRLDRRRGRYSETLKNTRPQGSLSIRRRWKSGPRGAIGNKRCSRYLRLPPSLRRTPG